MLTFQQMALFVLSPKQRLPGLSFLMSWFPHPSSESMDQDSALHFLCSFHHRSHTPFSNTRRYHYLITRFIRPFLPSLVLLLPSVLLRRWRILPSMPLHQSSPVTLSAKFLKARANSRSHQLIPNWSTKVYSPSR